MYPPSEKVGGHVPRVPHQIAPMNITKNNYRVCICGEMETELHLFFHCNVHCAARTALHNKVHDILNETGFAERFERLGHTDLLR